MKSGHRRRPAPQPEPARLDAALVETLRLLERVRREEEALARLALCVADLHAIFRARATLSERTRTELAEATDHCARPYPTFGRQGMEAPDGGAAKPNEGTGR